MEQVPHQQAHEVARTRAGKSGIDPGGGAEPPGGHGVGGLARQWPRGLTPAAAACEGGGAAREGGAVRTVARAKAAARARGGGAREKRPPGRAARRGRAARVETVR